MKAAANPEKSAVHEGQTYYFCSTGCVTKFNADPLRYLSPKSQIAVNSPIDAVYTCPMDPEVQQIGPGSCPKCGMALEPMQATIHEDTSELDDMTRRFIFSLVLSLPLLLLSMSEMLHLDTAAWLAPRANGWLQSLLATPVVLWFGAPFLQRATESFRSGHLNMFSLIGVGVIAAWLFSLVSLIVPEILPIAFTMHGIAPLYFEAAAVIVTLVLLGQVPCLHLLPTRLYG
jgi:cation transport ATPase